MKELFCEKNQRIKFNTLRKKTSRDMFDKDPHSPQKPVTLAQPAITCSMLTIETP